jgi:hypothetical protein
MKRGAGGKAQGKDKPRKNHLPLPPEAVSQCHSEAKAEKSLHLIHLKWLDSSLRSE